MSDRHLFALAFLSGALASAPAAAQSAPVASAGAARAVSPLSDRGPTDRELDPLSESAAVRTAAASNPGLQVAILQAAQAAEEVRAEEGIYSPVLGANAGITHSRTPSLAGDGTTVSTSDVVDVGASITKPFPFGTVVSLSLGGERILRQGRQFAGEPEVTVGPGYAIVGQLALTQPLLRGAGSSVGLANLRVARLVRTATVLAAHQTASVLLRDVLRAYWELWYADQVVRINRASRELSREQARQAELQASSGAIAEIDALVYTTRLAELEEAVVLAATDRSQRSLALALLLGQAGGARDLAAVDSPPEPVTNPGEGPAAVAEAERTSPELQRFTTDIAVARDRLRIAGDAERPRLDLEGYVLAQGLGNREVPPAFEQFGKLEAVSAHAGLTFEMPLDRSRYRSQVESSRLAEHIALKQLEVVRQRLRTDVLSALSQREAAARRLRFAEETTRVARAQAEAERRRFAAGISIALQVQEAEDSLRQAELRVERARVDATLSDIELAHLRGRLLERHRGLLRQLPPAPALPDAVARGPF